MTIDVKKSDSLPITLTADLTISSVTGAERGLRYWFAFIQDVAGGHGVTWPANVLNAPTIDTSPNATTVCVFIFDGVNFVPPTVSAIITEASLEGITNVKYVTPSSPGGTYLNDKVNAALATFSGQAGLVVVTPGNWTAVDSIIVQYKGQFVMAQPGPVPVTVTYDPTFASHPLFVFGPAAGGPGLAYDLFVSGIEGFQIVGTGVKRKIAIQTQGASNFYIRNISLQQWTGNQNDAGGVAGPSIGIQTKGHELVFLNKIAIAADRPISIEQNVNNADIGMDHFHLYDSILLTLDPKEYAIRVASGVILSNIHVDGTNSIDFGLGGIYYDDTSTLSVSTAISLRNIRVEQPTPIPTGLTVTPTGGAAGAQSYRVVANIPTQPQWSPYATLTQMASVLKAITNGPATLDVTHYNDLAWSAPVGVTGAITYDVYRITGGATQGKIASGVSGTTLRDNGLVGDGSSVPAGTDPGWAIYLKSNSAIRNLHIANVIMGGGNGAYLRKVENAYLTCCAYTGTPQCGTLSSLDYDGGLDQSGQKLHWEECDWFSAPVIANMRKLRSDPNSYLNPAPRSAEYINAAAAAPTPDTDDGGYFYEIDALKVTSGLRVEGNQVTACGSTSAPVASIADYYPHTTVLYVDPAVTPTGTGLGIGIRLTSNDTGTYNDLGLIVAEWDHWGSNWFSDISLRVNATNSPQTLGGMYELMRLLGQTKTVHIYGSATIDADLSVTGNADITGALTIGSLTLTNLSLPGTLDVTGQATLRDTKITQATNGDDCLTIVRATDTAPTGNFMNFVNAALSSLWRVDIAGELQAGSVPIGRVTGFTAPVTAGPTSHQFVTAFNAATGAFTLAQPSAADLSNGTTGSGAVVLAASPTVTGTLTAAALSMTSALLVNSSTAYCSVTFQGTAGGQTIWQDAGGLVVGRLITDATTGNALFIDTVTNFPIIFRPNVGEVLRLTAGLATVTGSLNATVGFKVNGVAGYGGAGGTTQTYKDGSGVTRTFTIAGGIITANV